MRRFDKILGITAAIIAKQNIVPKTINWSIRNTKSFTLNYKPTMCYNFSTKKPQKDQQTQTQPTPQNPKQPETIDKKQQETTNNQQSKSRQLTKQQAFNLSVGLPRRHSFKNQLILSQNKYKKQLKELREAILFEDLLKKEMDILLYQTNGKPYVHHLIRMFLMLVSAFGTLFLFEQGLKNDKRLRVYIQKTSPGQTFSLVVKLLSFLLILATIRKHIKFTRRFVQSITYHTQDQTFTFVRRKMYGAQYKQKISRFKILYTENPALLRRGTNYLNIQNQNEYSIGYVFAWKKQDLFSHLISQRIKV